MRYKLDFLISFQVKSNFEIGNVFNSHGSNIYLLAGTTQSLMDAIPKTNLLDGILYVHVD